MKLFGGVELIPIVHGKAAVANAIRQKFNQNNYDEVVLPLPSGTEEKLIEGVDKLPQISIITLTSEDDTFAIPIDPCDPFIEAVRQSIQKRISLRCVGSELPVAPLEAFVTPDDLMIEKIGYDAWITATLYSALLDRTLTPVDRETALLATEIREFQYSSKKVAFFIELHRVPALLLSLKQNSSFEPPTPQVVTLDLYTAEADKLLFILGELPFITGEYEKNRSSLFEESLNNGDLFKRLFLETRDNYCSNGLENLSLTRIQQGITFLRNLTIQENRLTPSLFNMVTAAKGVGGDNFALKVLKAASYYPFLSIDIDKNEMVSAGLSKDGKLLLKLPQQQTTEAVNLLSDVKTSWKTISIKPDRELWGKKHGEYRWNMQNLCSHLPEDIFIENFNQHVRGKAIRTISEQLSHTEEFTSSIKDGIDIRETLRNWHTNKLFVKEFPSFHGGIDTIVVIFDELHDEKYPLLTTWYAEHEGESTLSFYSTDPFENLVGPGVGECSYGGFSLLYPPKPIPDISTFIERFSKEMSLNEQLALFAIYHSSEKVVAYISKNKPSSFLIKEAKLAKKMLLHIPLTSFSDETLRKLKKFHMLDGDKVRGWASRFIGE
jgi:hypothetical protein